MKELAPPIDLNNPERYHEIRLILEKKTALKFLYQEIYQKYAACLARCPKDGIAIEIGSGAGFVKEIVPNIITTDAVAYPNVDRVMDATQLDFADQSLSGICMFNVLHHIADAPAFFREASRCLKPGGRIFMMEPYLGFPSTFIYRYLHHEPMDTNITHWEFESKGPVSDANIALPHLIFHRDIEKFRREFPHLSVLHLTPHSPLRYWLTGGLTNWSLLPQWAFGLTSWIDKKLTQLSPRLGSFFDIELIKV